MLRLTIPYSIACGAFLAILFGLTFYFGLNPFMEISQLLFDVIVFGVFSFFLVKDRKQRHDHTLHFWEGMSLVFLLSISATLLFLILLSVYQGFYGTLVTNYQEAATKLLIEKKEMFVGEFGEMTFDEQLEGIRQVTFPMLMLSVGIKKIIAGLFLGPVITVILRTKPK